MTWICLCWCTFHLCRLACCPLVEKWTGNVPLSDNCCQLQVACLIVVLDVVRWLPTQRKSPDSTDSSASSPHLAEQTWDLSSPLSMEANTATSTQVCVNVEGYASRHDQGHWFWSFPAEWSQRDLERNENVKFCKQYIVFHDDKSVVFSAPSGNCTEVQGVYVQAIKLDILVILNMFQYTHFFPLHVRLLSKDSPSGEMKAVVRKSTVKGEDNQFLEVWCFINTVQYSTAVGFFWCHRPVETNTCCLRTGNHFLLLLNHQFESTGTHNKDRYRVIKHFIQIFFPFISNGIFVLYNKYKIKYYWTTMKWTNQE